MRNPPFAISAAAQFEPAVWLSVRFLIGSLTPRGLRERFVETLRLEIARAEYFGEIACEIAEELRRALPPADLA